ncbi:anti-sigma factor RsbA family regulatory protein [Streptomyces sp. NPDC008313]|uniref:anti-sigma factor RsbA family regulatory protein n=1 Tax=Streptomyces sp. NPDC008313 TaxID=3364826 RepID=UPI0036E0A710
MTGTAPPGEPFVHPALFYRGDREYLEGTVCFLRDGMAAAEPVAVAAPPARLELIRAALGTDAAEVHFVDMTRAGRNPGRIISSVLRAFADRRTDRHVRIVGEPVWPGRTATEYPACVQHEALINTAFRGRDLTILCPYDAASLPPNAITDAHATHPVVVDGQGPRASAAYDPDRVLARCNAPLRHPPGAATARFGAESLPTVRDFALRESRALGMSGVRLQDLGLVVAELTTNSVVHAGGSGTLRVWAESEQIVCEVRDEGHLTDPLAGRRPARPEQIGGRGLLLVHHVSDLVRVHTGEGGTTIRCYLDRD